MHETALRDPGRRAELLPGGARRGGVGDWLDGYLFALSGPDLRRHQRDPAQHHRRAHPRPAEEADHALQLQRRPAAAPDHRARLPRRRVHRRSTCAAVGDRDGRSPRAVVEARRARACPACSCPRSTAGWGWTRSTSCSARGGGPRRAGRARDRTAAVAAPLLRGARLGASSVTWLARSRADGRGDRGRRGPPGEPLRERCAHVADLLLLNARRRRAPRRGAERCAHRSARQRPLASALQRGLEAGRRDARGRGREGQRCLAAALDRGALACAAQQLGVGRPADRRWRSTTPASASSSACRSARSRPSSTCWPT